MATKISTHRTNRFQRFRGQLERLFKRARLKATNRRRTHTAAFITGCQRSGTKMVLKTLDQSPDIWTHDHRIRDLAYALNHDPGYQISNVGTIARLTSNKQILNLIARGEAPVLAFHALADSQRIKSIFEEVPMAKAVWIYRHYADVAQSAVHLWGNHQTDLIGRFHRREFDSLKWRAEEISQKVLSELDACYRDDLSPQEGGALMWYTRNQFFFHCGLDQSERALLIKYEDLVSKPEQYFPEVFEFLGVPFHPKFISHIFSTSIRKQPPAPCSDAIRSLCDHLQNRLDEVYQTRRAQRETSKS